LIFNYEISAPISLNEKELISFIERNCKKLSLDFSSGYNYDDQLPDKIEIIKKHQYIDSELAVDWNESGQLKLFFDGEEVSAKLCNWSIIPNQ
jgi:hypothetical protein